MVEMFQYSSHGLGFESPLDYFFLKKEEEEEEDIIMIKLVENITSLKLNRQVEFM